MQQQAKKRNAESGMRPCGARASLFQCCSGLGLVMIRGLSAVAFRHLSLFSVLSGFTSFFVTRVVHMSLFSGIPDSALSTREHSAVLVLVPVPVLELGTNARGPKGLMWIMWYRGTGTSTVVGLALVRQY